MEKDNNLNFMRDANEILRALIASKENGTIVVLTIPSLGAGIFITAVNDVTQESENDSYIQLKDCDVTGFILERTTLRLSEILSVCPLSFKWETPYLNVVSRNDRVLTVEC